MLCDYFIFLASFPKYIASLHCGLKSTVISSDVRHVHVAHLIIKLSLTSIFVIIVSNV